VIEIGGHKMIKIRHALIIFWMLFCSVAVADVQVNIGINVPVYPRLVVVPGYPVYYAPQLNSNYFFYDGLYWVYQDDNWYESSWYNGPWWLVYPEDVPLFILRVPVRYYRLRPTFFFGWSSASAPRWGEHWGRDWEQRRNGWDRWDRRASHTPAPLPSYQQQYSGDRYPRQVEQQHEFQKKNYRYDPRDPVVQQQYQKQQEIRAPAQGVNRQSEKTQQERHEENGQQAPENRSASEQDNQHAAPNRQITSPQQSRPPEGSRSQPTPKGNVDVQRSTPTPQQRDYQQAKKPQPQDAQREQKEQRSQGNSEKGKSNDRSHERNQNQGQEKGKGRND